ncbi:SH3 domain-containing protein [Rossellomorea aquimaris]|uniref:SH3 domain-containing protein n=1 Tax=Rossellomorea aquimaris TaxID=189382 RepID=UPI0009F866F1|nr:SH3 domain-containing protein [Rossellomorea aquimaris]
MKAIKRITAIILVLLLTIPFLPTADVQADEGTVSIGTATLNVRTGPGLSYPVLTQVHRNQQFSIVETKGGWYKITTGSGDGWVADWLVIRETGESLDESGQQGTVNTDGLRLRKGPSTSDSVVTVLNKGDKVAVSQVNGSWIAVQSGNAEGWVHEDFVTLSGGAEESGESVPQSSEHSFATISANSLNVRSEPSLNGDIVGKVNEGEQYAILNEKNNWFEIRLSDDSSGWIASWFAETTGKSGKKESASPEQGNGEEVTILHDGTNIRSSADVQSPVVERADGGESFAVTGKYGDWYEIRLEDGSAAYVAGWIVSLRTGSGGETSPSRKPSGGISGKLIVIDPGHGGRDSGTIGTRGTLEKLITMKTGKLLADKLEQAGAEVVITRKGDEYVSLPSRVSLSHYYDADAFISIHFDSINDGSIAGHTTYYNKGFQEELAYDVHESLASRLPSRDRGVRIGDYHVIRENKQAAVLLELGFLSNPAEEANMTSGSFQDLAATAIYHGLNDYFSD